MPRTRNYLVTKGNGLACPRCAQITAVKDSRPLNNMIKRARQCLSCGFRFKTWETSFLPVSRDRSLAQLTLLMDRCQDLLAELKVEDRDLEPGATP